MPARKGRDILLYWTDRILRSPRRQLFALCLLVLVVISAGAALLTAVGSPGGWATNFWSAWSKVTGLEWLAGEVATPVILVNTALTLAQWFVFGFLVSMIGTAVSERLRTVRSGASHVLDRGHTVILGWNETVYAVIDLLLSEDEGAAKGAVVVLSAMPKDAMEDQIRRNCRSPRAQRTICRTGAIDSVLDLQRVNLPAACEVIVIGEPADDDAKVDGCVLRATLACSQAIAGAKSKPHVLIGHRLLHTGRLVGRLSGQWHMETTAVHTLSVLVKIIAQCAWQSGLATVYRDLLTYGSPDATGADQSNEIYCISAAKAGVPVGTTFEQIFWGTDRAIPVGYIQGGQLVLCPLGQERKAPLAGDDKLVLVAASREGVKYRPTPRVAAPRGRAGMAQVARRSVWLVGKGVETRAILTDLVHYLPEGSKVASAEALEPGMPERAIEVSQFDPGSLELLDEDVLRELVKVFDTIVISSDERGREQHDTAMLAQMSAIRSVCEDPAHRPVIVGELLDQRNSQLAANMDVRDILVTPELASNYMVQMVKDPSRAAVYRELLSSAGAEIYVRPADLYLPESEDEVSWAELQAAAWGRGEILLGYFQTPSPSVRGEGLVLNPRRRDAMRPVGHYHRMVVLARD